jgi:hypothetical protein
VVVTGIATGPGADVTRTLWYETVRGAAYAQQINATTLTRKIVDPAGKGLASETDPVHAVAPVADAPLTLSEEDLTRAAAAAAANVGVKAVTIHYVPLFGGTDEIVVQPEDPSSFVQNGGSIAAMMGPLKDANRPYLITVVDSSQAPLLILGYTPGVGGGGGQGVGWDASSVHSGALSTPVTRP